MQWLTADGSFHWLHRCIFVLSNFSVAPHCLQGSVQTLTWHYHNNLVLTYFPQFISSHFPKGSLNFIQVLLGLRLAYKYQPWIATYECLLTLVPLTEIVPSCFPASTDHALFSKSSSWPLLGNPLCTFYPGFVISPWEPASPMCLLCASWSCLLLICALGQALFPKVHQPPRHCAWRTLKSVQTYVFTNEVKGHCVTWLAIWAVMSKTWVRN